MLLVDANKLEYISVLAADGLIKIGRKDRPAEFEAVIPPIKVKLGHDILVVFDIEWDEDYNPSFSPSWLRSTEKKFKDDYLDEVWNKRVRWRGNSYVEFPQEDHRSESGQHQQDQKLDDWDLEL